MIMEVFSLKDDKVGFSQPFFFQNTQVAIRSFIATVRAETANPFNTFPEDKSFYHLGHFDDQTGVITMLDKPACVCYAASYVLTKKSTEEKNENDV